MLHVASTKSLDWSQSKKTISEFIESRTRPKRSSAPQRNISSLLRLRSLFACLSESANPTIQVVFFRGECAAPLIKGTSIADSCARQQCRSGSSCSEKENAAGRYISRNEAETRL